MQLSGGEKQRLALARAFIKQANLLLLDEATSALDVMNEKAFQDALEKLCKGLECIFFKLRENVLLNVCLGRTTLIISHRLKLIQSAHHIYVIHSGQIIERGTHQYLMSTNGKYHDLVIAGSRDACPYDEGEEQMSIADMKNDDDEFCMYDIFHRGLLHKFITH